MTPRKAIPDYSTHFYAPQKVSAQKIATNVSRQWHFGDGAFFLSGLTSRLFPYSILTGA